MATGSGGSGGWRSIEDMDVMEKGSSSTSSKNVGEKSGEPVDTGQCSSDTPSDRSSNQSSGQTSGESSPSGESPPKVAITAEELLHNHLNDMNVTSSSRVMDLDIIISYLKQFATDIMYSGFVELVGNIMKVLLTKYDGILDHSFLIWTVGFFLSFAHQQELEFDKFKEVLNVDLFGYLVYEAVSSCEALEVKHSKEEDCPVEKHRVHLVVCTLNQLFRTLMAHSKMEYLVSLQKCLVHMTDLHHLFVLLIRLQMTSVQGVVYLRDLVQTNHVFTLMLEEWVSRGFTDDVPNFSMLAHIKQFATHPIMAKYGSLLEQTELSRDTLNVAVLTMMYHVAGDCQRQDTLMQLPILKAFSEIWVENAISDHAEFNDLVEFVLEMFMSYAENDPGACVQKLLDEQSQVAPEQRGDAVADESGDSGDDNDNGDVGTDSQSGDRESSMNVGSSSCSNEEFTEEEQNLIFTWVTELEEAEEKEASREATTRRGGSSSSGGSSGSVRGLDREKTVEVIQRKLMEYGFCRSKDQICKHLQDNGFIEAAPISSSNSSVSSSRSESSSEIKRESSTPSSCSSSSGPSPSHDSKEGRELGSLRRTSLTADNDDNLMTQLVVKLKGKGFEPQLHWLQEQLLEAAYVKLVIANPSERTYVEQPVAKFNALQSKCIPLVAWNEDMEVTLKEPYFVLLLNTLGLITKDSADVLFPRIPHYFTAKMLVDKVGQIDSANMPMAKFDVDTIKEKQEMTKLDNSGPELTPEKKSSRLGLNTSHNIQSSDIMWLNAIHKLNGDMDVGSL